jgi:hypothetical protein
MTGAWLNNHKSRGIQQRLHHGSKGRATIGGNLSEDFNNLGKQSGAMVNF